MKNNSRFRLLHLSLIAMTILVTEGCVTTSPGVRSWVDEDTAVSATAQEHLLSFIRNDVQNGINIVNYADIGAFELNEAGRRRYFFSLLDWSAVTRVITPKSRTLDDFSTLTIWADNQEITIKRTTQDHSALRLGQDVFSKRGFTANQNYYETSVDQLVTISKAKVLRLAAANQTTGDAFYRSLNEDHASLAVFTDEASKLAKLANQIP